eukprot:7377356-Prymnesium_polylepis.2
MSLHPFGGILSPPLRALYSPTGDHIAPVGFRRLLRDQRHLAPTHNCQHGGHLEPPRQRDECPLRQDGVLRGCGAARNHPAHWRQGPQTGVGCLRIRCSRKAARWP